MKKIKLLSSVFILSFIIVIFSVMVFSFGVTSLKKENISLYNSDLITSDNKSLTEESGWSLEQLSTSTDLYTDSKESTSNSSVILTDPEGNDYAYVWGSNVYGLLGIGKEDTDYYTSKPILVDFDNIEYSDIKFLSTYNGSSMAVLTDENGKDSLYAWGNNSNGQLGLGDIKSVNKPTLVTLEKDYDEIKWIDAADSATSIVLTTDGNDTLWTTGSNKDFRLGLGDDYDNIDNVNEYTQVTLPEEIDEIVDINFSNSSTMVADVNGENILYTWGSNEYYQSNSGDNKINVNSPEEYTNWPDDKEYKIKEVDSTSTTTLAVLIEPDGKEVLYAWGSSKLGQAGIGTADEFIKEPTLVRFSYTDNADIVEIKDISMGETNSSAITIDSNGKEHLYLWGNRLYYVIGDGSGGNYVPSPLEISPKIEITDDYTIKEINLGTTYAGMIVDYKGSNQLYMWGKAYTGGLGEGNYDNGSQLIKKIKKWDQTPMITFDKGNPFVINDNITRNKMLSFTLDWDELSVTPTKLEIIDSEGKNVSNIPFIGVVEPGIEIKQNIIDIAPEGIDNVRLKVSNDNKTLVISQSFDIPGSLLNGFDNLPIVNYNWMTAHKDLSFTLDYNSNTYLTSIEVWDAKGTKLDISIDENQVKNGVEYNVDISQFNNKNEIEAYILVNTTIRSPIKSDVFIIPATKFKGWIIVLILLISLVVLISIIITILMIKIKIKNQNKISKIKAKK